MVRACVSLKPAVATGQPGLQNMGQEVSGLRCYATPSSHIHLKLRIHHWTLYLPCKIHRLGSTLNLLLSLFSLCLVCVCFNAFVFLTKKLIQLLVLLSQGLIQPLEHDFSARSKLQNEYILGMCRVHFPFTITPQAMSGI